MFAFRGLEFHSARMWQWAQVERALDFMAEYDLNALIFHQNDIVEHLVFPEAFFSDELMWKRWPVRMHSIYQNRHYVNKVVREAKSRGIDFYFETKEISFVDELLEIVPGLRQGDAICPTNPFWWELLDLKMAELCKAIPEFAGVIVSPGTRESKVSMSVNSCTCSRCESTDPTEWYSELLAAMHKNLAANGKTFAVRDFSYTADQQSRMIEAAGRVSRDIVISLKNTPHDYYPTFPDNPRIGNTGGLRQWVEYDTWGQFFGMGVFPVSVAEDMQGRMRHALVQGVEGISLRTDWEVITDAGSFNSPNILNVIAGALLARDIETPLSDIYAAYAQHGLYSPLKAASEIEPRIVPTAPDAAERLQAFMTASWSVMEKAAYVRGHLFHEDDQFCDTVDKAFAMLVHIHGRDEWEPGASSVLEPTAANLAAILAEKDQALAEVRALPQVLDVESLGLPEAIAAELSEMLELYEMWVRGFVLCAKGVFHTRAHEAGQASSLEAVAEAISSLSAFREEIIGRLNGTHYPHYVYWLLDEKRVNLFIADLERILDDSRQPQIA
jgi:hypothetical protein